MASGSKSSGRAGARNPVSHVALLRGINVGGKHKLPMATLAKMFAEAGAREVRTYIQSGNVVFQAPASRVAQITDDVSAAIRDTLAIDVPITTRTGAELAKVAAQNPFLDDAEEKALHVAFLQDRPKKADIAKLDPDRSPGDAFRVVGREIYLHLPQGVARTKLTTAWFDRALDTVSTMRNWRTVQKLLAMLAA